MMPTVADVLELAAEIVEEGWCQGADQRITKLGIQCCARGAICAAIDRLNADPSAEGYKAMLAAYDHADKVYKLSLATWNDADGRTADEVATMIRTVAKLESSK
jgi:hypothetical protein